MNTTSQMLKEASEIYGKYFPKNVHRNILYMATVTEYRNFVSDMELFLRKLKEANSVLEEFERESE